MQRKRPSSSNRPLPSAFVTLHVPPVPTARTIDGGRFHESSSDFFKCVGLRATATPEAADRSHAWRLPSHSLAPSAGHAPEQLRS